jgi:serine/threonine protein phosphatase PrpC
MSALVAAATSETGRVRQSNEDAAFSGRWLFAVADGLGGHAAGEVASAAVIGSLCSHDQEVAPENLLEVLGRAVAEANAEVARRATEDPGRRGMATTLTAMLWSSDHFVLAHIGDSRAFRLREGQLEQLTEDHVLGKLVSNAGVLGPVLSRYLDGRADRSPDLSLRQARARDRYMICSDGLSPVVSVDAIRRVLVLAAEPDEAVRGLVALADDAGAPDNVTVVVVDFCESGTGHAVAEPAVLGSASTEVLAR